MKSRIVEIVGILILVAGVLSFIVPNCPYGGVETVTATNQNGSTTTVGLIRTPVCYLPYFALPISVGLLGAGVAILASGRVLRKKFTTQNETGAI